MDAIRLSDFVLSAICLVIISPVLLLIAIAVKVSSKGPALYKQVRVGKNGNDFTLLKFRTMHVNAENKGLLTVGGSDARITFLGYYLRKFKVDELPQVINVLKGDMSIVGPRPEVRRYVDLYNQEQRKVLLVLPGITDYASIAFRNENEILAAAADPEYLYIHEIMPRKIELNATFITNRNIKEYFSIIFKTVVTSIKGR